mgnify:FL=1
MHAVFLTSSSGLLNDPVCPLSGNAFHEYSMPYTVSVYPAGRNILLVAGL